MKRQTYTATVTIDGQHTATVTRYAHRTALAALTEKENAR